MHHTSIHNEGRVQTARHEATTGAFATQRGILAAMILAAVAILGSKPVLGAAAGSEAIRLLPQNPRYFEYEANPVVLVGSGEHYGAVLNPDFDFEKYLATLQRDGVNYTRLFAGYYVEPPGAFGIARNTLAPARERFLAPWARSAEGGYGGGGNRFDLTQWDTNYLARVKAFLTEARRRTIFVELTLFCSTYGDQQWAVHPLNPTNNVNGPRSVDWRSLHTQTNGAAFEVQAALTRHLVRELNGYGNLFYEIQNEPWADNHSMGDCVSPYMTEARQFPNAVEIPTPETVAWQRAIAGIIVAEEANLPLKHLIAQNIANFRLPVAASDLVPEAGILNFHYAFPEAATWNHAWDRAVGCDETGFAGRDDATYRREAWQFLFSGGGLFNHLDYSFSVGYETGTDTEPNGPGGGSPALRRQLGMLRRFLEWFDLRDLRPVPASTVRAPGAAVWALGSYPRQLAVYLEARGVETLTVDLPAANYGIEWLDPVSGQTRHKESRKHPGGTLKLAVPFAPASGPLALAITQNTPPP